MAPMCRWPWTWPDLNLPPWLGMLVGSSERHVRDSSDSDSCLSVNECHVAFLDDFGPERARERGCGVPVPGAKLRISDPPPPRSPAAPRWQRRPQRARQRHRPPRAGKAPARGFCAVCMDAPADAVVAPCFHGGICVKCARRIAGHQSVGGARCPQCRVPIQGVMEPEVELGVSVAESDPWRHSQAEVSTRPAVTPSQDEEHWLWPQWCQGRGAPIEVFVWESPGKCGRWVAAQAKSRLVDTRGHDSYLCAEYDWDGGERFAEDFEPERVRKRGEVMSVAETLLLQRPPALDMAWW